MSQPPTADNRDLPVPDSEPRLPQIYAPSPYVTDSRTDSHWDASTKRTVLVILLVTGVGIFWISRPVLTILIIGGIVAYLLSPIVDLAERVRIPRSISTIVLYLLLLVALILTPILLLPVLLEQLNSLNFNVPYTASLFVGWMQRTIANLPATVQVLGFNFDMTPVYQGFQASFTQDLNQQWLPTPQEILSYINQAIGTATTVLNTSVNVGFSVVGGVFSVIFFFFILFFISLYLTKDAPVIRAYVEGLFPRAYQSELGDLFARIGRIWQAFFRGQIILSLTVGFFTWAALSLAGMPGALILAILAGALEIIPNLGPIIAMIPAVIVALIQGSDVLAVGNFTFALLTVGIYFLIQQFENNLLVPRIIGTSVNLHPVVVICGVVVGASVGGILGAFLAAPVIASARLLGSYVYNKLLDYPAAIEPDPPRAEEAVYRRVVHGDDVPPAQALPEDAAQLDPPTVMPQQPTVHDANSNGRSGPDPAGNRVESPDDASAEMPTEKPSAASAKAEGD